MKKTLLILIISFNAYTQVNFFKDEFKELNLITDPYASIKDRGVNVGIEYEYVYQGFYVKQGVQNFAVLKGGYTDIITTFGTSLTIGNKHDNRFYAGVRAGWILRGSYFYATGGFEAGADYIFKNGLIIGLRTTYDYREDFKFTGANPKFINSGFIKIAYKINLKRDAKKLKAMNKLNE